MDSLSLSLSSLPTYLPNRSAERGDETTWVAMLFPFRRDIGQKILPPSQRVRESFEEEDTWTTPVPEGRGVFFFFERDERHGYSCIISVLDTNILRVWDCGNGRVMDESGISSESGEMPK